MKKTVYVQSSPLYKRFNFAHNFDHVRTLDELKAMVEFLYERDRLLGFDIETGYTGADYPKRATNVRHPYQFIAGFSITDDVTWARYVPLRHDFANNLNPEEAWTIVKPLLEDKVGVAHNLAFEAENLRHIDTKGDGPNIYIPVSKWHDSMIQAYVLSDVPNMPLDGSIRDGEFVRRYIPPFFQTADGFQSPEHKSFLINLKSLTKFRYNYDQADIFSLFSGGKELTKKQQDCIRFNTLPVNRSSVHYACDDAYLCLQLHYDQHERIMDDPYLPHVYDVEMKTTETLVDMKEPGVSVDWEGIDKHYHMYESFLHNMKVRTRELFEEESGRNLAELNFNSTQQMAKLIYGPKEEGNLGFTAERVTEKGNPSTDDKALTSLRKKSPAIDSLLRYRQCIKMGDWFKMWQELSTQTDDGKIHPSFIQVRVQSGRFASAGPNVQNITKRWWFQNAPGSPAEVMKNGIMGVDYWTGNARDFLIASPGYKILSFDYKSAEIQMLAALAQEDEIIEAFYSDEDFHKWTASLVFDKKISEVTKFERQAAKAVSFGLIYGQSESAMAQQLGIPLKQAQEIRAKYFARFPKLAAYFDYQHALVDQAGEVRTWLGRKAVVWERMHAKGAVRSKASRMSVNIPVQGGATGDYTKIAMINSRACLIEKGWWNNEVRLLMNQHDSLVFEVSEELDIHEVIDILTPQVQFSLKGLEGLHDTFEKFPPMSVDWEIGYKWGSITDADKADILDAEKLEIRLLPGLQKEDLDTMMDIIITNPGEGTVTISTGENEVTIKNKVKVHPDTLSKVVSGDPDMSLTYKNPGLIEANFV